MLRTISFSSVSGTRTLPSASTYSLSASKNTMVPPLLPGLRSTTSSGRSCQRGCGTAITAACVSFWQLTAARFLFGLGAAGAYPNMSGVLYRWFPKRERARGQGVIWAASRLGGALAPLLLVPMNVHLGWQMVFVILGLIGFVWAILWWRWYHDRPADQPGITAEEVAEIGEDEGAGH